VLVLFITIQME